jgi:rifampin ADP-ribosylating transferase
MEKAALMWRKLYMVDFSKTELEAAHKAISSSIRKIEKAQETLSKKQPPPKAQITLAARNLSALRLSLELIERELDNSEMIIIKNSGSLDSGPFYHGTKAELKVGDILEPGFSSNYGERKKANYIYLTATLDAAVWGAELAVGDNTGWIYVVEPTGIFEDDPNLTDKKFPGNPTRSYRTQHPLRIIGEIVDWKGHSPEDLKKMRDLLDECNRLGIEAIND